MCILDVVFLMLPCQPGPLAEPCLSQPVLGDNSKYSLSVGPQTKTSSLLGEQEAGVCVCVCMYVWGLDYSVVCSLFFS